MPNAPSLGHWFKPLAKRDSWVISPGPLHSLLSWSWGSLPVAALYVGGIQESILLASS